jgi:hypothetical protein
VTRWHRSAIPPVVLPPADERPVNAGCASAESEARFCMPVEKELVNSRSDENFRKGACHAAEWLLEATRTQAAQGRTATEVSEHLSQLVQVLADWRAQMAPLPDGNPWDWSFKDLALVIKGHH